VSKFVDRWERKESASVSTKVKETVRPPGPLKPRLDAAVRSIQLQIQKLEIANQRFNERDRMMFSKVVDAYSKHDIDHREEGRSRFDDGEVIGDMTGVEAFEGDISMMPISVGVNFHVMQKEKINFYVGPFISYVMYGDVKWDKRTEYATLTPDDPLLDPLTGSFSESISETSKIKSDFGFGAVIGIDVPFGSKGWTFSSSLKYLSTKAQVDEEGWTPEIDINPWILNIGVGYKF